MQAADFLIFLIACVSGGVVYFIVTYAHKYWGEFQDRRHIARIERDTHEHEMERPGTKI